MTIPSIPRGPERAWTTCVSGAAISGLFRSDYAPENVQALPPGMTAAVFDALPLSPECAQNNAQPFAIDYGCVNDCFPRYIPWVEQSRTPDFAGGDPVLEWTRGKGWEQREECVVPATSLIVYATFSGFIPVLDANVTIWLDGSLVPWLVAIPLAGGNVNFGPMPPGTTTVKVQGNSPSYGILDMGWQSVPPSGTYSYWLDYQPV